MDANNFRYRLFLFAVVVTFSVLAIMKIMVWQKENPKNSQKSITTTKIVTTQSTLAKNSTTSTTKNSVTTSTTTSAPPVDSKNQYQGENFSLSYPTSWVETSSQPKYLLVSSKDNPTNLTVKYDEEINNFPGYEKKSDEDILVLGSILKLEYWEPLALDDDFGSGGVNNLAVINIKKDNQKSLLIYSYQKSDNDTEKIKEFKTIIDSFKFK